MKTIIEKELFLLKSIEEKILISKKNTIQLKLMKLNDSMGSYISLLSTLQNAGILQVISVDKIGGTTKTIADNVLNSISLRGKIDFKDLEKNSFAYDDILGINIYPDFYNYFLDFCRENKITDYQPDQKLSSVIDNKEMEKVKSNLLDKHILWRCYVCRAVLPPITTENIDQYIQTFREGRFKSCPKGHHNYFKIQNGILQFCTEFLSFEKLDKYKLTEPIDKDKVIDRIEDDN